MVIWSQIAQSARQPKLARRLKLVAMALLFIMLSLAGFAAIPTSPRVIQTLFTVNPNFFGYVRLTNALIAIICAAFVLWPRKGSQLVGHWNDYLGLAFLIFFIQYGTRFVESLYVLQFTANPNPVRYITLFVVYAGSYLNNILFLAAARVLLNKSRQQPTKDSDDGDRALDRLKNEWLRFRSALPTWVWFMPVTSIIAMAEDQHPLWARIPDAAFSVYCLSWLAYALWLSFLVRRQRVLAWLALMLVLAYAAGQVVYAVNPFLAHSIKAGQSLPGAAARVFFLPRLSEELQGRSDVLESLDNAIFALLSPMKSLLFLSAFILYLQLIISVNDFRQALSETTSRRKDYLSTNGILRAIGRSMGAEEVDLIISLPGLRGRPKQEIVVSKIWRKSESSSTEIQSRPYPLSSDPLLVCALRTEGKEIIITNEDESRASAKLIESGAGPGTLALVPIKFHGGAIGALRVIFRGYGKYNSGTLEQLKFMAELIGPSVQDYRTVFAADKLSQRLIRELARKRSKRERSDQAADIFRNINYRLVAMLHDILNPLGVCLLLECGFTPARLFFPTEGVHFNLLSSLDIDYPKVLKKLGSHRHGTFAVVQTAEGLVRIEADQLSARTEEIGAHDLGTLLLMIPDDKDDFDRPTLAAYYLTRRMLASLTAQAIFSAARNALSVIIQDLGIALNWENLSIEHWFAKVEEAVKQSGCLWVVASIGDNVPLMGPAKSVDVLNSLSDVDRETLNKEPRGCISHQAIGMTHRHIIRQSLKTGGKQLWIGVERAEFGKELNFGSPWRIFLDNLASVCGAALTRIEDRQKSEVQRRLNENRRLRQAEDEWMQTISYLSATLVHQLINMSNSMLSGAQDLLREVNNNSGGMKNGAVTSIKDMRSNAAMMMDLTIAYNRMIERDGLGSCFVAEAARLAGRLFKFQLRTKAVEIEIDIPSDLVAKIPSTVVAMVVAGLIGNAIRAIESGGRILIKAAVEDGAISCHIINDGPPIRNEIIDSLFQPGVMRNDGHVGWGLYLISCTLSRYGGEVKLARSDLKETCFTLRLPKSGS